MIITAFRTGPALASTGLLPNCHVLRTEECALCGLPYILVITDSRDSPTDMCRCEHDHYALLREAITNAHAAGHPDVKLHTDGSKVVGG